MTKPYTITFLLTTLNKSLLLYIHQQWDGFANISPISIENQKDYIYPIAKKVRLKEYLTIGHLKKFKQLSLPMEVEY